MATTITKRRDKGVSLFHALSDSTRLEIMERLKEGEQCVCDLTDAFHLGQPTISHHLKVLREAGLVTTSRRGRWVDYTLAHDAQERMREALPGARLAVNA